MNNNGVGADNSPEGGGDVYGASWTWGSPLRGSSPDRSFDPDDVSAMLV